MTPKSRLQQCDFHQPSCCVRKHKPRGQATPVLQPHVGAQLQPPTSHNHGGPARPPGWDRWVK